VEKEIGSKKASCQDKPCRYFREPGPANTGHVLKAVAVHAKRLAIETTIMAADPGLVRTGEDIISVGGTYEGTDTVLVIKPAHD
jgi:hypothetical protein